MRQLVVAFMLALTLCTTQLWTEDPNLQQYGKIMKKRSQDWRNRQIVYQIFVDRFQKSAQLENKKDLYAAPRKLRQWHEQPRPGRYLKEAGCWSHEIEFWGGGLQGIATRIDYLKQLGVNTIYLNPIFHAFTNHKYDAIDYFHIDPQYGTEKDLQELCDLAHQQGFKVVLDGVFNHVGKKSVWFQQACEEGNSHRAFFYFGKEFPHGYRAWHNVANLPELNLENRQLQERIISAEDSLVRRYLQYADGWRLDVAYDLGPKLLKDITDTAHESKPGSLVIGEIWCYPDGWLASVDGLMNFFLREVILQTAKGQMSCSKAARIIARMVEDCGIEPLLQSWIILANHDTPRLKTLIADPQRRELALLLQFTLPGAPVVYYGEELGMDGDEDPENRGPMAWQNNTEKNVDLQLYKRLIALRNSHPALQYGDYCAIDSDHLLAFCRKTDDIRELVIVIANPHDKEIRESLCIPEYRLLNHSKLRDWQSEQKISVFCGMTTVTVPAKSFLVLSPIIAVKDGYTPYKRLLPE